MEDISEISAPHKQADTKNILRNSSPFQHLCLLMNLIALLFTVILTSITAVREYRTNHIVYQLIYSSSLGVIWLNSRPLCLLFPLRFPASRLSEHDAAMIGCPIIFQEGQVSHSAPLPAPSLGLTFSYTEVNLLCVHFTHGDVCHCHVQSCSACG